MPCNKIDSNIGNDIHNNVAYKMAKFCHFHAKNAIFRNICVL